MKYFAKIKYLGTDFCGFQVQPDKRTVQGELCASLAKTLGRDCKVTGCSRTDSGVHANEFCILIDSEGATVPPSKLPVASARFLPQDISVFYASDVDDDFHPRYDALGKEYLTYGVVYLVGACVVEVLALEGYFASVLLVEAFGKVEVCGTAYIVL